MAQRPLVAVFDLIPGAARQCAAHLDLRGYETSALAQPWELDSLLARQRPDLVIVGAGASGTDLTTVRRLAAVGIPVFVMLAEGDTSAAVLMLELGAADALTRTAEPRELVARVDRFFARTGRFHRRVLRFETALADLTAARILHDDGRIVPLSAGDLALLGVLAEHKGKVLSQEDIAFAAPAAERDADGHAVVARVSRLRQKLETGLIESRRGAGYVLRIK